MSFVLDVCSNGLHLSLGPVNPAGAAVAVGLLCSVGILALIGATTIRGVRRAPALARSLMDTDQADWRSSASDGSLVGGGSRASFAFVANHGGNIPMFVCAFDQDMVVLIDCRRMRATGWSTGWLKDDVQVRAGRRGFAEVIELGGTRVAVWRPRLIEVVQALRSAGWLVDEF